jgi:hypothetical protein
MLIGVSLLVTGGILQTLVVDLVFQLREAAEGLLYLHTRAEPVVHGDIKGCVLYITVHRNSTNLQSKHSNH